MSAYQKTLDRLQSEPRNWLVTGCAGFIGSNLAEALLRHGQRVVGLDNFSTGKRENLEDIRQAVGEAAWKRFRFIEGDVRSPETCLEACRDAYGVLHQAALGSIPRSLEDPLASHESNVTGHLNMLDAARRADVHRMVYASSSAVYGDHPTLPKVEAQTGNLLSPYGATKAMNELYAGVFARCYGYKSIGLRYFNVFGRRQDADGAYASVIPAFIHGLLTGATVYINGDGETSRDFCFIDNVVQANILCAMTDDEAALGQAYNVAVGEQTSLNDLYREIHALLAPRFAHVRSAKPAYRAFRAGDVKFSLADISRARDLLGYEPGVRVAQGLAETIEWYIAQVPGLAKPEASKAAA